ncbi:MAG: DUF2795 domain-containing protein [Candidatus Buchananbacteria bacterium]|jgi:hypothetical protein
MENVSMADLQRYLSGVTYPARKEDLVNRAMENGAPMDLIQMMEGLSEEEFNGHHQVMHAMNQGDDEMADVEDE